MVANLPFLRSPIQPGRGQSPTGAWIGSALAAGSLLTLLAIAGAQAQGAQAGEISATSGRLGLGTRVNGQEGGSCGGGLCAVGGGTAAGANLFHRFNRFDTRGAITGVTIDNGAYRSVVVGVLDPLGSFLNRSISLSGPAQLFFLSPGGVQVGAGAAFSNVARLTLSTASSLAVGGGRFEVFGTTAAQAALLNGVPLAGKGGLSTDPEALRQNGIAANGDLVVKGGLITVEREVLLDAQGGNVLLEGGTLQAPGGSVELAGKAVTVAAGATLDVSAVTPLQAADGGSIRITAGGEGARVAGQLKALGSGAAGKGGRIEVTGERVALTGAALDASGPAGGGTVLVGGGLHGANPAVPNATTTTVDGASTVRADALAAGDGGTVVAYGSQRAAVDGLLSARGGPAGGNGGFVETSGATLALTQTPDASAPKGKGGTWLIDPNNLTVIDCPSVSSCFDNNVSVTPGNPISVVTTGDNALVSVSTITDALNAGTSVILSTSPGGCCGSEEGNITVNAPIIKTGGGSVSLTLNAYNNIFLNSDITSSAAALSLFLNPDIDLSGSGTTTLASTASLDLNGGTVTFNGDAINNGNIVNFGRITGPGTLTNAGTIQSFDSPSILSFVDPVALINTGTITSASGTGSLSLTPRNFTNSGSGSLTLANGSSLTTDSLTMSGGRLQAVGNSTVTTKALNLSGGSIIGGNEGGANPGGAFDILESFNRSGGTIRRAFSSFSITQASGNLLPGALPMSGQVKLQAQQGGLVLTEPISGTTILGSGATGITLLGGATLTAIAPSGRAIELSAGSGAFFNNSTAGAGALAVQPGATWAIYADNPVSTPRENLGNLVYNFKQYNKTFQDSNPILGSGNGLFYAFAPVLTVNLVPSGSGAVSKVYDGTTIASLVPDNFNIEGVVPGDSVVFNYPSTGFYDNKNAGTGKIVSLSGVVDIASANETTSLVPVYGYIPSGAETSAAIGTISKAPLTVTANSGTTTYNGAVQSISGFTASPLAGSDTVAVLAGVSAGGSGRDAGSYTTTAFGTAANYDLTFVDGSFTINPSVTIGPGSQLEPVRPPLLNLGPFWNPSNAGPLVGDQASIAIALDSSTSSGSITPASTVNVATISSSAATQSFEENESKSSAITAESLGLSSDQLSGASTPAQLQGLLQEAAARIRRIPYRYTPAGLRLSFTPLADDTSKGFIDLVLIPMEGEVIGKRVDMETARLKNLLQAFHDQLGTQKPFDLKDPNLPARQLYSILIEPMTADLKRLGVTTLLIAADTSLQAIPFAALTDGNRYFGEAFAFSLTPSIRLTPLRLPEIGGEQKTLLAGASRFATMAPLPMVPQELERIKPANSADQFLNLNFTPSVVLNAATDPAIRRVHLATHAEFLPGGPAQSKLYTGTNPIPFTDFAALRQRRRDSPLNLFTLSACRTALGDPESELGFAGLALQAGARTAVGTLWYVDDVATSAFFVQFYRFLDQGLPKAEALQATRQAFSSGLVHLEGDRVVGEFGDLLGKLSNDQRAPLLDGLRHPYYWGGVTMLGSPW